MKARIEAMFAGAALLLSAARADAHALLINPPPLTNDDNAKSGPCGCYFGAAPEDPAEDPSPTACPGSFKVTDLVAGSQLQVTWKETVQHTGKFRVSISSKPIDTAKIADMEPGVLYDAADTNSVAGGIISATITVPDTPCENCVLQFRQYMETASTPYYYSCAAINITSPGSSASSSASSGTTGAGGMGGASGVGGGGETGDGGSGIIAGPAPIPQTQASGLCSASAGKAGSPGVIGLSLLGLVGIVARRRRLSR
jgi:MYXO-CTERM domain-containing protein